MRDDSASAADVKAALAEFTNTRAQDWHLVFKARYGMEVVFASLASVRGAGEVATQVFTCATAIDPIVESGLVPRYGEISASSIALDPDRLTLGEGTHAVVAQHTFGIVDSVRTAQLRELAHAANAIVVEDSAHCVARLAVDTHGKPIADVSIHSFGVEKVLPTRFGGAVWVNPEMADEAARAHITASFVVLPVISAKLDRAARRYVPLMRVLRRLPTRVANRLRATLTRAGWYEPAIAPSELAGTLPHDPARPSRWIADAMADSLHQLPRIEQRRSAAVAYYLGALAGLAEVPASLTASQPLVRFPFFAPDAGASERCFTALSEAGLRPGRWYRPALFPGVNDPAVYHYTPGDGSVSMTEDLIDRVVNLPTDVDLETAARIVNVVITTLGGDAHERT